MRWDMFILTNIHRRIQINTMKHKEIERNSSVGSEIIASSTIFEIFFYVGR